MKLVELSIGGCMYRMVLALCAKCKKMRGVQVELLTDGCEDKITDRYN